MVIVIQPKKKKNYFTTKEPKKSCVIVETKINFFATTKIWNKYQLTVANY